MLIAIPVNDKNDWDAVINEHFGHCRYFAFIDTDMNERGSLVIEENPFGEHAPGQIPNYLKKRGIDMLIVRGIGQRAIAYFNELGIDVIRGADGSVGSIIDRLINGNLKSVDYAVKEKYHDHKLN